MMEKLILLANTVLGKLYINCGVPADKQMHFISGFFAAAATSPFIGWWALALVASIAALKEWYDSMHPTIHTADFMDFVATFAGGLLAMIVYDALRLI